MGAYMLRNYETLFKKRSVYIYSGSAIVGEGVRQDNDIFRIFFKVVKNTEVNTIESDVKLWHERLGHINQRSLVKMAKTGLISGIGYEPTEFCCEGCQHGQLHRKPFGTRDYVTQTKAGDLIHSGAKYYVNFNDNGTGY